MGASNLNARHIRNSNLIRSPERRKYSESAWRLNLHTKTILVSIFVGVGIYLKVTAEKSPKSNCSGGDIRVPDTDRMTGPELLRYIYYPSSSSCKMIHDFGGVMSRLYNGLLEPTSYQVIDGQKSICMDRNIIPKSKCLVYSFGIRNEWSFDEAVERLGCQVYAFDPSMNATDHDHTANIHFYKIGIGPKDVEYDPISGWKLMTLKSIYRMLQPHHGDVPIDYLKIDIESAEWDVIPEMIRSGMILRVKQMGAEIHFKDEIADKDLREKLGVLKSLEGAGMVRFASRPNIISDGVLQNRDSFLAFEMVWYNSRLAH